MKNPIFPWTALLFVFLAAVPCAAQQPIAVEIVNNSGLEPDQVYVLLTGDEAHLLAVSGIQPNVSTKLHDLTNNQFTVSAISSGRIIFSFNGTVAANQQPNVASPRFDKVELTYPGAANLTAVDFFGIPFKLETLNGSGQVLQALTFYTSKDSLAGSLTALAPDAVITTDGQPAGPFARILSPTASPSSYPGMQTYVNSVAGKTVTIAGTYVGAIGPSPNTFDYSGTFGSDGTITLSGTMTQPATPNSQPLTVAGATLASAIYTNNGPYTVTNATNNPQAVSNNDIYSAIYRDLVAGFDFGYIGGKYGSNSASWYGTTPYNPPYACARSPRDGFFNHYASIIANNSDAYGFPFSDLLALVQVGLNAGGTNNVAKLRITILPDDMVDAPIITSTFSTDNSISVDWDAISGATGYTVQVSPPIPAQIVNAGTSTSVTIENLNRDTPYTVSVVASNGTSTSEAIPVVVSTKSTMGSLIPVSGTLGWNFVPNFTGTFPSGHTITFNGMSQPLPTTPNPGMQFNNVPGQPGQENAYVFKWTDENQDLVFSSILYVKLESCPTCPTIGPLLTASIVMDSTATFLAANQFIPTYCTPAENCPWNLFLSIAPGIQRTICPTGFLGGPGPSSTIFGSNDDLKVTALQGGKQLHLKGTATDVDGLRGIAVTVTTSDGRKTTYPASLNGSKNWKATVQRFGSTGTLLVEVTAVDRKGNVEKISYSVSVPVFPR
jgi:hypothetical protein